MAYSDYGGYAYRNGRRIIERSDATITPEGDIFGTPGMWPGFAMIAEGIEAEEVQKRTRWPHGHVVLGDGPIYVALYKQSSLEIYRANEQIDLIELVGDKYPKAIKEYDDFEGRRHRYFDPSALFDSGEPLIVKVDGYKVEAHFLYQDNYYMYVKLTQPDGNLWHGWSGYGVGAGLEHCGYGFSTKEQERTIKQLWPEAIEKDWQDQA